MAREASKPQNEAAQPTIVLPYPAENKPSYVICDVCGHRNPEDVALCKMCSNYLEGVKR